MQSHLELAGPAVVPDMMYGTLDIFNPHNAKLLAATAAGMPCLLLNFVVRSFHLGPHHSCHQFLMASASCCRSILNAMLSQAGPGHAVLCCAVLCCAVLCCAVLCCAVLCCAVLCCAMLFP